MKTTTYKVQQKNGRTWVDFGGEQGLPSVRKSIKFYRREYPHMTFRLVRVTTITEAIK